MTRDSRHPFEYDAAHPNHCRYCGRTRIAHKSEKGLDRMRDAIRERATEPVDFGIYQ